MSIESKDVIKVIKHWRENVDTCKFLSKKSFVGNKGEHIGTSDTSIYFLKTILDSSVVMKTWLNWDDVTSEEVINLFSEKKISSEYMQVLLDKLTTKYKYGGLLYEVKMYRYVTKKIILPEWSECFIPLITFKKCSLSNVAESIKGTAFYDKFVLPAKLFPQLNLNIMVTGSITSDKVLMKLGDKIDEDSNISLEEANALVFQMLHAVYMLEKFKIMHNDLHFGNVLVEILPKPRKVTCKLSRDVSVSFKTKMIPKIFDWDRAYCTAVGKNPFLDSNLYRKLHSSNQFIKNHDYYQVICEFLVAVYVKNFKYIIDKITPKQFFSSWSHHADEGNPNPVLTMPIDKLQLQWIKTLKPTYKSYPYFYVSKDEFFEHFPKVVTLMNFDQYERYQMATKVYFKVEELYITVLENSGCLPSYDLQNQLLYPLKSLFTDEVLFNNLTRNLQDFTLEEK